MPKSEADILIKECTKNGVLDTHLLEDKLALPRGTFDSGVVSVSQKVKLSDVKLPTSKLGGSLLGEWVAGGSTGGGITEGIVGQLNRRANNSFYKQSGRKIKVSIYDYR